MPEPDQPEGSSSPLRVSARRPRPGHTRVSLWITQAVDPSSRGRTPRYDRSKTQQDDQGRAEIRTATIRTPDPHSREGRRGIAYLRTVGSAYYSPAVHHESSIRIQRGARLHLSLPTLHLYNDT